MPTGRKLIKVKEFTQIMATGYEVEGTRLYVLELHLWGHAYSSYFILLRSKSTLAKLEDASFARELQAQPYKFGKKLILGQQLDYDDSTKSIFYVGDLI